MIKKITRKRLGRFLAKYASSKRILDVGSGGSSYGGYFPNRVAIDIDPARNPDIVADAHNLPFKDGEFDMILCTEVLEHLADPRIAIREMKRVLSPGGMIVLTTRFVYPLHDTPNDYWRFTKYGLRELFKDFDIVEIEDETRSFSTVGVLLQRICFQTKLRANVFTKAILFVLAGFFTKIDWLIKEEYGDIAKSKPESNIMPSGYYIAARKK